MLRRVSIWHPLNFFWFFSDRHKIWGWASVTFSFSLFGTFLESFGCVALFAPISGGSGWGEVEPKSLFSYKYSIFTCKIDTQKVSKMVKMFVNTLQNSKIYILPHCEPRKHLSNVKWYCGQIWGFSTIFRKNADVSKNYDVIANIFFQKNILTSLPNYLVSFNLLPFSNQK